MPQDESDGGEDCQSGAHGPAPQGPPAFGD